MYRQQLLTCNGDWDTVGQPFTTRAEAEEELKKFLEAQHNAVDAGVMPDKYDPQDWRAVQSDDPEDYEPLAQLSEEAWQVIDRAHRQGNVEVYSDIKKAWSKVEKGGTLHPFRKLRVKEEETT